MPEMLDSPVRQLINAARVRIAEEGMRGLSLRSIAQNAGMSLGSLSYRIGDKAGLIAQLLEAEHADQERLLADWRHRLHGLNLAVPSVLVSVITAWFEDMTKLHRVSAMTVCELLLEAGANSDSYSGITRILDAQDAFWVEMLTAHLPADEAQLFGCAIANYIRDELPFALAAGADADYHLLRASTIQCLASRLSSTGRGLPDHFAQLVAAAGSDSAEVPLRVDLTPGSKRAEVAAEIASLIAEQGVAAVSHRAVAARAGVSNSSVAHYFRTRTDLLDAGFGALVLQMRDELATRDAATQFQSWAALMRASHAIALAAARDPQLAPFALDMRRRRSENGRETLRTALICDRPIDDASIQAAALVLVGNFMAMQARGGFDRPGGLSIADLAKMRHQSGVGTPV